MTELLYAPYAEYGRSVRIGRSFIADAFANVMQDVMREFLERQALELDCMITGNVYPRGWGNPEIRNTDESC